MELMFSGVYGCDPLDGIAQNVKTYGFPKEDEGVRGHMGVIRQTGLLKVL